jgi:prepilin-type N-terminal cleavage/methylation domain-containing protein
MTTHRYLTHTKKSSGFTIVELLIVVVVIAILATITVVSYNGVTQRATQSSMQSSARQIADRIELYNLDNGSYPSSLDALASNRDLYSNTKLRWAYTSSVGAYCLSVGSTDTKATFNVTNTTGDVESGMCANHTVAMLVTGDPEVNNSGIVGGGGGTGPTQPTVNYPTRGGYTNITESTYSGNTGGIDYTDVNISSIPVGSWMMVVYAYTNTADPIFPSGWSTIISRHTVGSLQTYAFAKIKEASDSNQQLFDAPGGYGEGTISAVILWGSGSAPVSSWSLGAWGDRGTYGTTTTTVTPAVTTSVAKSLVLSISTERTSATETNYTSLTGATPWIWIPQVGSGRLQTITIGYQEKETPGAASAMTVTYPNPHAANATAIQVVIPPAS